MVITDPRALRDAGEPEVDNAGLTQAKHDPEKVDDDRYWQHPDRTKDQEELSRDNRIDDEVVVGDTRKHLGACKRGE